MTTYKQTAQDHLKSSWPVDQWPELFAPKTEREYVQYNFKHMPDDWFPKELLVVAKQGEYELGFSPFLEGGRFQTGEELTKSIRALRQAFWMQLETDRLQKEFRAKSNT